MSRVPGLDSWPRLLDFLEKSAGSTFETVVLDTADAAERLLLRHVCDKNKWASIETPNYGKGYQVAAEEFARLLDLLSRIRDAGKNVVVIAHAKTRKFEVPEEANSFDRWEMKLSKQDGPLLKEWADAVLFLRYKIIVERNAEGQNKARGGKRVILTEHAATYDAKNRWGLPQEIPFENDGGTFAKYFAAHCVPRAEAAPEAYEPPLEAPAKPAPAKAPAAKEPAYDASGPVPTEEPKPAPAPTAAPSVRNTALRQLMEDAGISEAQLRKIVAGRGYYPESVPVDDYDESFVKGCLVACWPQIRALANN